MYRNKRATYRHTNANSHATLMDIHVYTQSHVVTRIHTKTHMQTHTNGDDDSGNCFKEKDNVN